MNYFKLKKDELIKKCKEFELEIKELKSFKTNEKLMIEESPDSIIYLENNLKIVYINKQASKLLQYESTEISGQNINILSNQFDIGEYFEKFCEKNSSIEFMALKKDSSNFFCEMKMASLYNSNEEKYGYMVIIRDISSIIKAKKELEESENKYRTIIENSNDNIIITKNEKIEFINYTVEKTTGFSKEEVIGTNIINYIIEEDKEKVLDFHKRRILGDNSLPNIYETIIIDKYGNKINIEINNTVLELNGEKCVISFLRDITKRKSHELQKEKNYQDKLKYQQKAMDLALDGIAILDKNRKYIYINDAFVKMNNYDCQEDFKNKKWDIIYSKKEINKISKSLNGDSTWFGIVKGKKKNNEYYDQEISVSVLEDGGFITVIRDITKSIEKENQLKKAKEKAEESDNLKSAFLANMSHELRTPINSIQGFADIINNRKLSKKDIKKFTKTIKRRTEELVTLISDILDISRIEAGQVSITDSKFSLNYLIDDIYSIFEERIKVKNKNIILKTLKNLKNDNDYIVTDQTRLKQIISNLVDNAIKFTNKGRIEIGYDLKKENIIEFFVKDTGIGMSKEDQKYIFKRFRQAENSKGKTYGGTGLGLTICKSLVELMGGKIWVQSEVNKGTVFFFTIPSKTTIKQSYYNVSLKESNIDINKINWSNKKILYVEDDEDNINLMKVLLKPTKASLIICKNGVDAEKKFIENKNKLDLVLMDIRIPKQNGLETTSKIKKINENIPVIAQTAYAMKGDEEKMKFYGCDDYITKPINETTLLKKIDYYFHLSLNNNSKENWILKLKKFLFKFFK